VAPNKAWQISTNRAECELDSLTIDEPAFNPSEAARTDNQRSWLARFSSSGADSIAATAAPNSPTAKARLLYSVKRKGAGNLVWRPPWDSSNAERKESAHDRSELPPQGFHRGIAEVQRSAHQIGRRQCHPLVQ
jgi:hypothetical protein